MPQFDLAHIISVIILLVLCGVIAYLIISHQRKIWKEQNKLHQFKLEQQQKLTRAIIEAQENERERIAKDLHDEIGALAVSLKINNEAIRDHIQDPEMLEKVIEKNDYLANSIIKAGRQVSHDLLPPALRQNGLISALRSLSEDLSNPDKTMISFECENQDIRMDEMAELSIYRVIKEWANNVIKHANASELNIRVNMSDDKVRILSSDNGHGFNYEEIKKKSKGLGLMNIEGRLNDLNASFEFVSKNGSGTQLIIEYAIK